MGKLRYPERMKRAYGLDPLKCVQCGAELWLWYVWHPDYGVIYDELAQLHAGKYDSSPAVRMSKDKNESGQLCNRLCSRGRDHLSTSESKPPKHSVGGNLSERMLCKVHLERKENI